MPLTGMGSIGLFYIVWPVLLAWIIALFFVLRLLKGKRVLFAAANIVVMVIVCVWIYPQDTPMSFRQKLDTIGGWMST